MLQYVPYDLGDPHSHLWRSHDYCALLRPVTEFQVTECQYENMQNMQDLNWV